MFALNIIQANGDDKKSQVGGGAWLPESFDWPLSSDGETMRPLLTINQDIFILPTIPEDMAVTVFSPVDLKSTNTIKETRNCAINDEQQKNLADQKGMVVYLHHREKKERLKNNVSSYPKAMLLRRDLTDAELKEDLTDDINGIYISKVLGRPAWLQDEIFFPPSFEFCVQITEQDLIKNNKGYDGIFRGGSCYLFLRRNLKKLESGSIAGTCFIQFT